MGSVLSLPSLLHLKLVYIWNSLKNAFYSLLEPIPPPPPKKNKKKTPHLQEVANMTFLSSGEKFGKPRSQPTTSSVTLFSSIQTPLDQNKWS